MHEFLQSLVGRRVAVVGNGAETVDRSAEIDACDVVIRFNHMYNLASGRVGRKVSHVVQTFTSAWGNAQEKHLDVLRAQKPRIWIGKKPEQYNPQVQAILGAETFVGCLAHKLAPWAQFTTGGATLAWLAHEAPEAEFHIFGFNLEDEAGWKHYIATDAKHYALVADAERRAVREAVAKLESLKRAPAPYAPQEAMIVIPCKGVSLGAPGKNAVLLPRMLRKLEGRKVTVITDSDALSRIAREAGVGIYMLPTIPPFADVTDSLRQWASWSGHDGRVVLVQCTSPNLDPRSIDACLAGLDRAPITATAVELGCKANGILLEMAPGVWGQALPQLGAPSVPRQKLPKSLKLTGAVTAFHVDALAFPSLFHAGRILPVVVPEAEALDVDTPEELSQAQVSTSDSEPGVVAENATTEATEWTDSPEATPTADALEGNLLATEEVKA